MIQPGHMYVYRHDPRYYYVTGTDIPPGTVVLVLDVGGEVVRCVLSDGRCALFYIRESELEEVEL